MTVLLEVRDVDLYYTGLQALAGVCIEVRGGEIVAIVGANGAGKSSLIRAVSGIARPQTGQILFAGKNITGLDPHEICNLGIGQVAEGRQLFAGLTVAENLEMGAMVARARSRMRSSMDEVFTLFPLLRDRRGQRAGTLSGGEQQMLAIGRGLMSCPELIMLDEPSLGLAPTVVQAMFGAIRSLNERGLTILLVEQNVSVSLKISRHGYVLENGRVVMSGPGRQLLDDERIREAYIGV